MIFRIEQKRIFCGFLVSAFVLSVFTNFLTATNVSAQYISERLKVDQSGESEKTVFVPAENVRLERTIPLNRFSKYYSANLAVDPMAVYSNVTNYTGTSTVNNGAAIISGNTITRLIADDLSVPAGQALPYNLTGFRFNVANFNTTSVSARPRIRFYLPNGAGGGPGTLINAFSFNPISFPAGSIQTFTVNPLPSALTITSQTIWTGITFDNNTGATEATATQMNNLGQGAFNPVNLGSSADRFFRTTSAGSFASDNPAGGFLTLGGNPAANFGWELLSAPSTAAAVEVGGRALTANGSGIPQAVIYLTDQNGQTRTAKTNSFGYFKFDEVEVGQTYIFNAFSKSHQFLTRVITVQD